MEGGRHTPNEPEVSRGGGLTGGGDGAFCKYNQLLTCTFLLPFVLADQDRKPLYPTKKATTYCTTLNITPETYAGNQVLYM